MGAGFLLIMVINSSEAFKRCPGNLCGQILGETISH